MHDAVKDHIRQFYLISDVSWEVADKWSALKIKHGADVQNTCKVLAWRLPCKKLRQCSRKVTPISKYESLHFANYVQSKWRKSLRLLGKHICARHVATVLSWVKLFENLPGEKASIHQLQLRSKHWLMPHCVIMTRFIPERSASVAHVNHMVPQSYVNILR